MSEDREFPPQTQDRPGLESEMAPEPQSEMKAYFGSGKLAGRRALITGGDSGIGRAVSIAFAKEGADLVVAHLEEERSDAEKTARLITATGSEVHLIESGMEGAEEAGRIVEETVERLGGLDLLVLHHGTQYPVDSPEELSSEQWEKTLRLNLSSFFHISKAALRHFDEGATIVMTGSVNGFRGNGEMIDYAVSKGGIHNLVASLSQALQDRGIRVNGVAPGPVWTPLIVATFDEEKVSQFGKQSPMGRAAQPDEIAPAYVFLASNDLSSYFTGQMLGATGGEIHPG